MSVQITSRRQVSVLFSSDMIKRQHFRNCCLVWRLNKDGGLAKPSLGFVQFDHRQQHRISKDRLTDTDSVQFDCRQQHQISKDRSNRTLMSLVMTFDQSMRLQSAGSVVVCCNQSFKDTTSLITNCTPCPHKKVPLIFSHWLLQMHGFVWFLVHNFANEY